MHSWSRRAGWRLARAAGHWDRVAADLRATTGLGPGLASLGVSGVRNWLETSAAATWAVLSNEQADASRPCC